MLHQAAPAKINLFLHAGAQREDGYHELESLVVFTGIGDDLTFDNAGEAADALSLDIAGPFAAALKNEPDNLVLRAARALGGHGGARITLTKNLPVASGIGGGSADAAATLRGLMQLWKLTVPPQALHDIALSLGSDVPVCLASAPAWMTGRGEHIQAVNLNVNTAMVLANPGMSVSTAQVFANLDDRTGMGAINPDRIRSTDELCEYLKDTRNDLEAPARELAPVIGDVLDALSKSGALLARMSGSGATCFGIYEDDAAANKAASVISKAQPNWWVKPTNIASSLPSA
ncbi:MAG TPA: 4-(cytidine 5'-diphospho)-2-C-methyl-D-erythritol kinase [Rhizomicrobium sp.]|nr:4-(cytidine 5'-diphospho)-2-C-methyl-D-erythritol kinase [Rhizomicrobium sp.]